MLQHLSHDLVTRPPERNHKWLPGKSIEEMRSRMGTICAISMFGASAASSSYYSSRQVGDLPATNVMEACAYFLYWWALFFSFSWSVHLSTHKTASARCDRIVVFLCITLLLAASFFLGLAIATTDKKNACSFFIILMASLLGLGGIVSLHRKTDDPVARHRRLVRHRIDHYSRVM